MKLHEIMSADVLTLAPGQPASDGLALMRDAGVRHAVVTSGGDVVGVVSERDLGGPHGGLARKGRSIEDLMRRDPTTASPSMTVTRAAMLVREEHIGCLPIVEGARLVGIVTRGDLLDALAKRRKRDRAAARTIDGFHGRPPRVSSPNRDKFP